MVSSKCWAVVSPSPFRFFAALMPPCAHTECERLTGTMEKRSTLPPASAILMTAASPASPPPTTMILGAAIVYLVLSKHEPCEVHKGTLMRAQLHARVQWDDVGSEARTETARRSGSTC